MIDAHESNVAILLLGYCRPELLSSRLTELYEVGAQNVFISIDGPKEFDVFAAEIEECQKIANLASSVNGYSVILHSQNLGLSRHVTGAISSILSNFDWVIVVEDDIKLGPKALDSFYAGIQLAVDHSIEGTISGFSFYGNSRIPVLNHLNFWRRSQYFSAWGWAISKTSWEKYELQIPALALSDSLSKSKVWNSLNSRQQASWISKFEKVRDNPLFTWDFQMVYASFVNDWSHILPVFRFVDNEGFGDSRGTHTKGERPANLIGAANTGNLKNILLKGRFSHRIFSWLDSSTWILDDPLTIRILLRLGKIRRLFTKK